jgi:hypothetical protein
VALPPESLPRVNDLRTLVERPKVIFNPHTRRYMMWMHLEQGRYHFASAGIAVSDKPAGPFTFLRYTRPITNDFGFKADDPNHQREFGGTFRDTNLTVDAEGESMHWPTGGDDLRRTKHVRSAHARQAGPFQFHGRPLQSAAAFRFAIRLVTVPHQTGWKLYHRVAGVLVPG